MPDYQQYIVNKEELDKIERRFNVLINNQVIPWEEDYLNIIDDIRSRPIRNINELIRDFGASEAH